jgi:hypothetical protein
MRSLGMFYALGPYKKRKLFARKHTQKKNDMKMPEENKNV